MPYKVIHGETTQIKYSTDEIFAKIKHENIRFIDLQFSSLVGRYHHTTISADTFTPDQMKDGLPKLDGSSIIGFTSVDDSDLVLKPDPNTFAIIPWVTEKKTARMICDVYWGRGRGRLERDPRGIAQRAEEYLKTQGFDFSYWGPEVEFFVFDKVQWDVLTPYKGQSYSIESKEAPWNQEGTGYPMGLQEGYYPSTPSDTLTEFRNECVDVLNEYFGILCDNHHHEVATAGQCEIDIKYDYMTNAADEEKFVLESQQELEEKKDMILSATLNGRTKLLESVSKKQKTKPVTVRFVKDFDQFVGADYTKYGPYKAEDIATLPNENAQALIAKNISVKLHLEE